MRNSFALAALLVGPASALDNGLALTPPMGWRSWNCYHGDVSQAKIEATIDAITDKSRGTSLAELGFKDVGVDDGWQACGTGRSLDNHSSFHDASGKPLLNATKFQDVKAMVEYGHKKGCTMGWYDNNCMCMDSYTKAGDPAWQDKCNKGDVQFLLDNDFDSVKIDNCGDDRGVDFTSRMAYMNASGKAFVVENSNQGFGNPSRGQCSGNMQCPGCNNSAVHNGCGRGNPNNTIAPGWCDYNLFRTCGDIGPDFGGVMSHLDSTRPYQDLDNPISRPGCWAYPDMLEVGNFVGENNLTESRTHFGGWCVVSAPLVLGMDITDKPKLEAVWPIISNKEAIAVNQAWAGHPGRLAMQDPEGKSWRVWAKAMPAGGQAVLVINLGGSPVDVSVDLSAIGLKGGKATSARDIWAGKDVGSVTGTWTVKALASHDSAFVRFS